MDHPTSSSGDTVTTAVTTPSLPLATFDVNKFLKKTFSDYDIGLTGRIFEQDPSPIGYQCEDRSEAVESDHNSSAESGVQRRRTQQRRAGSVPATSKDILVARTDASGRTAASNEPSLDDERHRGRAADDRKAANRRSRLRDREERCRPLPYSCAYCGQEAFGRPSTNSHRNLYCAACTSFFTRHSPSELQRRIAYEEMTKPSTAPAAPPVASAGTASSNDKETAPLLSGGDSSKVVIVANDDRDGECENSEILQKEDGQQRREEVEEVSRYRYARNDRPQGRGHGGRFQVKARQAPLLPYRQQQQVRAGRVQLRDDSSSKVNSWFGETAPVVVWSKENHSNNSGSRRSSCTSASSLNRPTCRICHLYGEPGDTLLSPCRCAGTMQYVHTSCLVHWLEISTKKVLPSPQCELCGYHYRTHHCYRFRRMHAPTCNRRDRVLHVVFVIMLLVMIGCAALSAVYLRQDKGSAYKRASLNAEDIVVIASALLFFCAFFVAVFTQYRTETSVCRLCLRCWLINRHWRVKDYDRRFDYERHSKVGHSVVMEQI